MNWLVRRVIGLGALGWSLGACTTFDDARACQSLAEVMNPTLEQIQAAVPPGQEPSAVALRAQAGRYRSLAKRLNAESATFEPLSASARLFAVEFLRVAEALEEAAAAREGNLSARYRSARNRLTTSNTRLLDLKKQISRRCG